MTVPVTFVKRKHPPGLPVLFFTEMWERFSFYCMLSILALYMNEALGFSTAKVGQIYGAYIGLVYFSPLFGGLLADRVLGFGRAILIGAVFMGLGHFLLAFPPLPTFFAGLGCLIIGNGLFKPNISTLLGNLYRDMPEKRDEAYNIFYMGINVGAFFSPLVAAWLRNAYGWHYAFGAAGIGMIISLILFASLRKYTVSGETENRTTHDVREIKLTRHQERSRIFALLMVFAIVVVFWMAFHQNGYTLTFWARDATDATNMPTVILDAEHLRETGEPRLAGELTQAINPFFVLAFTPLLVMFWTILRHRRREPSTAAKIGIGMLLTAGAYAIMTGAGLVGGDIGRVNIGWLISTYAVITMGELCLSPMGLSLVNKLAPARMRGLLMGGWFAATATGNYLSGLVGSLWDHMPHSSFFMILSIASVGAAGVLLLVIKKIRPTIQEAERMALEHAKH
ncbi:peptide MFS transporter [bacterium]|nr:peptide MFS transporter [bacterium]MBU1984552.1 peptide MFS transporter [bacterium]